MRFRDYYLPDRLLGYEVSASPRFSTDIVVVDSGAETVNVKWSQAMHVFTLPEAIREPDVYQAVLDHWMVMNGPAYTFPFRNPMDFSSSPLIGPGRAVDVSGTDQQIGVGNGSTNEFQIIKNYVRGPYIHQRKIYLPVVASVKAAIDGVDQTGNFTVTREGGKISFSSPPGNGTLITVGYHYDVCVRFESDDSFDGIAKSYAIAGVADLQLVETLMC